MAISADSVFELRTTGDDLNGGGFVSSAAGVDYSQQDAAQKTGSDLAIHASNADQVNPVAAGVSANDVGNIIQITAGTGFTPGWYEILSQDGTYWTLDRVAGTIGSTGGTYYMGGCFATLGGMGACLYVTAEPKNRAWIESGTYTLTSSIANVSGGKILLPANTDLTIEGYDTTRGDEGVPEINAGAITSVIVFATNGNYNTKRHIIRNIKIDGNSGAGNVGFGSGGSTGYQQNHFDNCEAVNCVSYGFDHASSQAVRCKASYCGQGIKVVIAIACTSHDNTNIGFIAGATAGAKCIDCISYSNGTAGFSASQRNQWVNCISYNNGTYGFWWNTYGMNHAYYCVAVGNDWGFRKSATQTDGIMVGCAGYDNTSGDLYGVGENIDFITLTGDPFNDSTSGDFNINDTSGAGAELRAVTVVM